MAASSFDMKVKDPYDLISQVNIEQWNSLRGLKSSSLLDHRQPTPLMYLEPSGPFGSSPSATDMPTVQRDDSLTSPAPELKEVASSVLEEKIMKGKVQRLGDYIDTDAVCHIQLIMYLLDCNLADA